MKLSQLDLQVDVAAEELGLGALAQRRAQSPACHVNVLLPNFKLSVEQPDLGEGEHLVRDQVQAALVNLEYGGKGFVFINDLSPIF